MIKYSDVEKGTPTTLHECADTTMLLMGDRWIQVWMISHVDYGVLLSMKPLVFYNKIIFDGQVASFDGIIA